MSNDTINGDCRCVYVVDDDEVVLQSTDALLSQNDYRVTCFSSARAFLAKIPLHSCGCLIADVQMPEMTGTELIQQLADAASTLSVIVISGVADVPTAVSVMQHGAATLLEKPYNPQQLLQSIDVALARSCERWQHYGAERSLRSRLAELSDEERAVMKLMLHGEPNKAIASELGLSLRTVDRRRQAVLTKMQTDSVPTLATLLGSHFSSSQEVDTTST